VEYIPIKLAKGGNIIEFLIKYIISRYGVPSKLFMDDGTSFRGIEVRDFCDKYHIKRKLSTPYYLQGNGQAKASNKFIKSILSKTITKHGKASMNNSLILCGIIEQV